MFGIAILSLLLLKVLNISAQSMRLQDAPLGSVVQIGSFNYIKVAENKYMQSTQVTCPDGATMGGKYVKCFASKTKYEEQCSEGSGSCQYEEADTVTTKSGTYPVYNYICDVPCYSPNAHYNDDKSKCICDEDDYSYISANGNYGCIPSNDLDIYTAGIDFDYTGNIQTFTVPVDGTYKLEVWGAQGGGSYSSAYGNSVGGFGGYSVGNITLNRADVLYIVVGQQGQGATSDSDRTTKTATYNGGGRGSPYDTSYNTASSGGGATHIAVVTGLLSTLSSQQNNIVIVAGGGGGGGTANHPGNRGHGGQGGGHAGGSGVTNAGGGGYYGRGGTQNSAGTSSNNVSSDSGSFGKGGENHSNGAGGGGGLYGGGGAYAFMGAGGGSGYLNTSKLISGSYSMYCYNGATTNTTTACGTDTNSTNGPNVSETAQANYAKSGNGYARITLISVD